MPEDQVSTEQQEQQGQTPAPSPAPQPTVEQPKIGGAGHELPEWAMKERKELREEAAQWRVKLREERDKWNGGLAKTEADALRGEFDTFKQQTLRADVGKEAGLSADLIGRIQGSTREEMLADALLLAGGRRPPQAAGGGLTPGSDDKTQVENPRDRARRTYRAGNSFVL